MSELAIEIPSDSAVVSRKRLQRRRRPPVLHPKAAPYTRENLDRRSLASKQFDAQIAAIKTDLGGTDDLSSIELQLIENFAGLSVAVNAIVVDLLLGKPVNVLELCALNSASVRVASRLGLKRRAREVSTPALGDYLADKQDEAP